MLDQENEFEECSYCKYIEECPHPTVDYIGRPIPPENCPKSDKIILTKKPREDILDNN
jgi:hypothetical protein